MMRMVHTPLLLPYRAESLKKPDYSSLTLEQVANAFSEIFHKRTDPEGPVNYFKRISRYWSPEQHRLFHEAIREEAISKGFIDKFPE